MKSRLLGGLGGLACCQFNKLYLLLLHKWFHFDRWHATAPYCCRPYKKKVIDAINSLNPRGVIEVGCGLGDIGRKLNRLHSVQYYGLDIDVGAIRAARYLAGNHVEVAFGIGSFEALRELKRGKFDTLLLLNWPHNIEAQKLVDMIMNNINNDIRLILLDGVKQSVKSGYKYKHSADKLRDCGLSFDLRAVVENIDEVRDLLVFERR